MSLKSLISEEVKTVIFLLVIIFILFIGTNAIIKDHSVMNVLYNILGMGSAGFMIHKMLYGTFP